MLAGYLVLSLGVLAHLAAFLGLRQIVARSCGVRGAATAIELDPRAWAGIGLGPRVAFVAAGPLGCYLATVAFFAASLTIAGKGSLDEASMRVLANRDGSGAAAGLRDNDRIVSVDGAAVSDWAGLKAAVGRRAGEAIDVTVERNGRELTLRPTPSAAGKIGVSPVVLHEQVGVLDALRWGLVAPVDTWRAALGGLARAISGRGEVRVVAGPVAIVKVTGEVSDTLAHGLRMDGVLGADLLWIPAAIAAALFPRRRGATP